MTALNSFFVWIKVNDWLSLRNVSELAGTLVPITGFSNAVVSPAIDNKAEGFVMGLGAKLFVVAGPVIVYGTVASVLYGVVYWLMQHF